MARVCIVRQNGLEKSKPSGCLKSACNSLGAECLKNLITARRNPSRFCMGVYSTCTGMQMSTGILLSQSALSLV